jgi:N6-adenosine-specific RNA methylase IME4
LNPYQVILADCPWQYRDTCDDGERGAVHKYPVMSTAELCALPVSRLADHDCALFLWATFPNIGEALAVMDAWGFTYSTAAFLWVKTAPASALQRARSALTSSLPTLLEPARIARDSLAELRRTLRATIPKPARVELLETAARIAETLKPLRTVPLARVLLAELQDADALSLGLKWGMGQSTRSNAEVCLLGLRGNLDRVSAGVHSVVMAPAPVHSAKPPEVHRRIVKLLGERRRIELFARTRFPGYDAWGNEVPGGNDIDLLNLPLMGQLPLLP